MSCNKEKMSKCEIEFQRHVLENFTKFLVITFVLIVNLYYCAKLIEGIVHRLPYKILPWIIINTVNIVELTVYFFTVDSLIGYITLIVYSYVWMGMIVLFFETKKSVREEIMECTMAESNTPYDTFPKSEV